MKKNLVSGIISVFMVLVVTTCMIASAKENEVFCSSSADVASIVLEGYNQDELGPIQIVQGTYTSNKGNAFDVYVVMVCGTENEVLQASNNGLSLDFAAVNLKNSPYYYRVKSVVRQNVPVGSRIVLVGHSLGGMMTQQLATDKDMKADYIIKYDLCFGAPLTQMNEKREGSLRRLGDWSDVIPYETANLLIHPKEAITYSREYGGYGIDFWTAHMSSYKDYEAWKSYDVTGKKGGKATLTLDMSTRAFYKSDYSLIVKDLIQEPSCQVTKN